MSTNAARTITFDVYEVQYRMPILGWVTKANAAQAPLDKQPMIVGLSVVQKSDAKRTSGLHVSLYDLAVDPLQKPVAPSAALDNRKQVSTRTLLGPQHSTTTAPPGDSSTKSNNKSIGDAQPTTTTSAGSSSSNNNNNSGGRSTVTNCKVRSKEALLDMLSLQYGAEIVFPTSDWELIASVRRPDSPVDGGGDATTTSNNQNNTANTTTTPSQSSPPRATVAPSQQSSGPSDPSVIADPTNRNDEHHLELGWEYAIDDRHTFQRDEDSRTWVRRRHWSITGSVFNWDDATQSFRTAPPTPLQPPPPMETASKEPVGKGAKDQKRLPVASSATKDSKPTPAPVPPVVPPLPIADTKATPAATDPAAAAPATKKDIGGSKPPSIPLEALCVMFTVAPPPPPPKTEMLEVPDLMTFDREYSPEFDGGRSSGTRTPRRSFLDNESFAGGRTRSGSRNNQMMLIPMEHWMKDDETEECLACHKHFSTFFRRHHCRMCGLIFCSNCSKVDTQIGKVRVCKPCGDMYRRMINGEEEEDEESRRARQDEMLAQSILNNGWRTDLVEELETQMRAEMERDMHAEYSTMSAVHQGERKAIEQVLQVSGFPSILQLSRALRDAKSTVAQTEDTNGTLVKTEQAALITAAEDTVGRSGMLLIRVVQSGGPTEEKMDKAMGVRLDARLGNHKKVLEGQFLKYVSAEKEAAARKEEDEAAMKKKPPPPGPPVRKTELLTYFMVQDDRERVELQIVTKSDAAIELLQSESVIARLHLNIRELAKDKSSSMAEMSSDGTRREKGVAKLPYVDKDGKPLSGKNNEAVLQWQLDIRVAMPELDFCEKCGGAVQRCTCHSGAQTKHGTAFSEEKLLEIQEALEQLVKFRQQRHMIEKRLLMWFLDHDEEAPQRAALRLKYTKDTTAAKVLAARRDMQRRGKNSLQNMFASAHWSLAALTMSHWHHLMVIHTKERRIRLARLKLEDRVRRSQGMSRDAAAESSSDDDDDDGAPVMPQDKTGPTSSKCCMVM